MLFDKIDTTCQIIITDMRSFKLVQLGLKFLVAKKLYVILFLMNIRTRLLRLNVDWLLPRIAWVYLIIYNWVTYFVWIGDIFLHIQFVIGNRRDWRILVLQV